MGSEIDNTSSICPECAARIPAELFERDGNVWMRKKCPEHGSFEALYWKDRKLFDDMNEIVGDYVWCRDQVCIDGTACDGCLDKTYNIMIEVTNKCNLDCPVCCSDANNPFSPDPTIEQILDRLPPVDQGWLGRFRRPNIVLFGGEPTVRKDLPELIRRLVEQGYVPRIATNGVRMTDEAYLAELRNAGLKWVILQFDGFDDDVSEQLRGERLQEQKLEAIEAMTRHGFKVQLGTMMVKDLNSRFAGDLIEFIGQNPNLFWLSFYPHAAQNRFELPSRETHMSEMLEEIETHTEGRLRARDFVNTMKMLRYAWLLFRSPNLRQKLSTMPMLIVYEGPGRYFALVRLLNPLFAIRKLHIWARLVAALPRVLMYQRDYTPPFLKFMVVEKFHNDDTIDLQEASNCHMSFMTRQNFMPFDIYNIAGKKHGSWGDPEDARKPRRLVVPDPVPLTQATG